MPLPETTLKAFVIDQSAAQNISPRAVYRRVQDRRYPNLTVRRVNQRVVFVSGDPTPRGDASGRKNLTSSTPP